MDPTLEPTRILVEDLEAALPHRPPMRWISEVIASSPSGGRCLVRLDANDHAFDSSGLVRQSSFLEWMAQGYAFVRAACIARKAHQIRTPQRAFLVSIQDARFLGELRAQDESAIVVIEGSREMGPLRIVSARVENIQGVAVATATLKLYAEGSPDKMAEASA